MMAVVGPDGEVVETIDVCPVCKEGYLTVTGTRDEEPSGWVSKCSDCSSIVVIDDAFENATVLEDRRENHES